MQLLNTMRILSKTALMIGFLGICWNPIANLMMAPQAAEIPRVTTAADSLLFLEKQKLTENKEGVAHQTLSIARSFLGAPYVHGCLDCVKEEKLVINLREMDCWTFVENSLAICQATPGNFDDYAEKLRQLRYWGGVVSGYGSRIHYFTGWLLQAEQYGFLQDITRDLGGIPYEKHIGYISARPTKYPKISDKNALKAIQSAEKRINAHQWHYIPKNRILQMEHLIQEGDIICLTSVKADLDIAHQGFAVKLNGRIHLMHASSLAGKVIIARQPLAQYVAAQRGQSGIMVARLL
jgi:hypothetical protein